MIIQHNLPALNACRNLKFNMYALMSDVGKVTLYDGAILHRENGQAVLPTIYKYEERMSWNPILNSFIWGQDRV